MPGTLKKPVLRSTFYTDAGPSIVAGVQSFTVTFLELFIIIINCYYYYYYHVSIIIGPIVIITKKKIARLYLLLLQ